MDWERFWLAGALFVLFVLVITAATLIIVHGPIFAVAGMGLALLAFASWTIAGDIL